jgi:hypothetical protein
MSAATGQSLAKVDLSRLQELRTSFDQTFAVAPRAEAEPLISLISVRVINKPFVLRSEHIIGIVKAKRITPFPSSIPECIGVAGIRGVLVPVFHLAGFLGLECPTVRLLNCRHFLFIEHFKIHLLRTDDLRLVVEVLYGARLCCSSEANALLHVSYENRDCLRKAFCISWRDQQTIDTMFDRFRDTADIRSYGWQPRGHSLKYR